MMMQVFIDFCEKMYMANAMESVLRSTIYKDFKKKGEKHLSSFNQINITKDFIDKNKSKMKILKHVDYKDDAVAWLDGENIVAIAAVDKKHDEVPYNWITAIEVSPAYQGYGLGKECLDYAVKSLKGNALTVSTSNKVALKMYKDYGFIASKESIDDVNNKVRSVYFMYLKGSGVNGIIQ